MAFSSLKRLKRRLIVDSYAKKFIAHNRKKWGWDKKVMREAKSVILVDLFDWNPFIYCSSYTANYLANRTDSTIEWFNFASGFSNWLGLPFRRLEKIYASFGAKGRIRKTIFTSWKFRKMARRQTHEIFSNLKTKADVEAIQIDGVKIGHLIYDTYLRRLEKPTIVIGDPRLKKMVFEACLNWYIVGDYLSRKNAKAMVISHYVYIEYGILVTCANSRGIPSFTIFNSDEFLLLEVSLKTFLQNRCYWDYRKIFESLDAKLKIGYLAEAKRNLEGRLSGIQDRGTTYLIDSTKQVASGYGQFYPTPIFKNTGRPRVLVLLNCFCDAPHGYRFLLFPDIWEWLNFLLTKASETPFDWYVKPHPNGMPANDAIVADFKRRFPKITFLERDASNAQMVSEGLSAMFTTYGTAAQEFAYMDVPVVTAGDSPTIAYDFNYHPKDVKAFEQYINGAGYLKLKVNKQEILEFYTVHYLHPYKPNDFGARIIDDECGQDKLGMATNALDIFEKYICRENPEKDRRMKAYFDSFFGNYFLALDRKSKKAEAFVPGSEFHVEF